MKIFREDKLVRRGSLLRARSAWRTARATPRPPPPNPTARATKKLTRPAEECASTARARPQANPQKYKYTKLHHQPKIDQPPVYPLYGWELARENKVGIWAEGGPQPADPEKQVHCNMCGCLLEWGIRVCSRSFRSRGLRPTPIGEYSLPFAPHAAGDCSPL
eukprot:1347078-Prymnesium_polylepis.1